MSEVVIKVGASCESSSVDFDFYDEDPTVELVELGDNQVLSSNAD